MVLINLLNYKLIYLLNILRKVGILVKEQIQSDKSLWTKDFITIITVNLLIFFGFQMLTPTLPVYVKSLGVADKTIGWITGIFTISALIIRPFIGVALDRLGRKGIFLSGLIIFIIVAAAYSWLPTIGLILLFRFIHGFGWGASSTASSTIASDIIPKKRFGEGMGYYSLASSLAMATAPAVGLSIISRFNFQVVSLLASGLVIISFILALSIKYRKVDKEDQPKEKIVLYEKTSVRPAIVIFFVAVTYGSITSFLALYALERGIENIGVFFTIYAISMLISRPSFGRVVDRLGVNFAVIPGLICIIIAMILLSMATTLPIFMIAALVYGIGFGATLSSLQTMAIMNTPRHRLGVANATFFTGFDSGIGFGAIILGIVSSAIGYSQMFLWSVLSVVIAFILYFVIGKKNTVEKSS